MQPARRPRPLIVCLLAAIALGLAYTGFNLQNLEAQAKPQAPKTAVAVVNVNELIGKSQKNIDFQAEMEKRRAGLQKEAEDKQKAIDQLRADLDLLPTKEERQKKEREIIKALSEFQAWNQIQQQFLVRDQQTMLVELYGDISTTVGTISRREGYDVVLLDVPSPDFSQLNADQLVQVINNRRIIYRAERVNISALVLEQMNLDYLSRGAE